MRLAALALTPPLILASLGAARADASSQLWYGRNAIYEGAGHCFLLGQREVDHSAADQDDTPDQ